MRLSSTKIKMQAIKILFAAILSISSNLIISTYHIRSFHLLLLLLFFLFLKAHKRNIYFYFILYFLVLCLSRCFSFSLFQDVMLIFFPALSVAPTSSEDSFDRELRRFLGMDSQNDPQNEGSQKRPRTEVGPSRGLPLEQRTEQFAPPLQQGSEASPGPGSSAQEDPRVRQYFESRENIDELVEEFRRLDGTWIPGNFQMEYFLDGLEQKYGGESLLRIHEDLETRGRGSVYYQESKILFDSIQGREPVLREEWQGGR